MEKKDEKEQVESEKLGDVEKEEKEDATTTALIDSILSPEAVKQVRSSRASVLTNLLLQETPQASSLPSDTPQSSVPAQDSVVSDEGVSGTEEGKKESTSQESAGKDSKKVVTEPPPPALSLDELARQQSIAKLAAKSAVKKGKIKMVELSSK